MGVSQIVRLRKIDLVARQTMCFFSRAAVWWQVSQGETNEEVHTRSRCDRRVCFASLSLDRRDILCGPRFHYSVVTEMKAGMKMMGKYDSKEAAEEAMANMKECKGG